MVEGVKEVVQRAPGLTPAVLRMLDVCGNHMGDIEYCLARVANAPHSEHEDKLQGTMISFLVF